MKLTKYILSWFGILFFLISSGSGLYFLYITGYSLALVLLIGFYSINLLVTSIVFIQTRQPAGKLSWMMVFLLLPFIGAAIFLIFGQRYKSRKSAYEYWRKETFKYEIHTKQKEETLEASLLNKQSNISKRGVYNADVEIFSNGDKGYKRLFEDLEKAEKFIHLQYYIIKPGEIFDQLKDILIRKAEQGVEIKFIVDDFGRWAVPWYEIKNLKQKGIHIERFGKVYFPFIGSYNGYRMHRKSTNIDGKIVHTGGINIADEYANLNKKFGLWMDYQIRITGASVRSYSLLFIDDWEHITGVKLDIKKYLTENSGGESKMILIEDSPENSEPILQDSIINMIINAKKEIILTTPYLTPTPELFSALRNASISGVKVKILIPGKADKKPIMLATRYYAWALSKYGVEVYEANSLLIHSKIGIFDNKYAYVGTANLDVRSMYSQWEIIQLLTGPIIKEIKDVIDGYLINTTKLSSEELKASKIKDILVRMYVNLFSPIM